jgi:hypothetical protein
MRGCGKCMHEHHARVWEVRCESTAHGRGTCIACTADTGSGCCGTGVCAVVAWEVGGCRHAWASGAGKNTCQVAGIRAMGTVGLWFLDAGADAAGAVAGGR